MFVSIAVAAALSLPTPLPPGPPQPGGGECYEPQGKILFPLDACDAYSLVSEIVEQYEQRDRFLALLTLLIEGPGSQVETIEDYAELEGLFGSIIELMHMQIEGADWHNLQIVDGSSGYVEIVLPPGFGSTSEYYLPDLSLATFGLNTLTVATPEGLEEVRRLLPLVQNWHDTGHVLYAHHLAYLSAPCKQLFECG